MKIDEYYYINSDLQSLIFLEEYLNSDDCNIKLKKKTTELYSTKNSGLERNLISLFHTTSNEFHNSPNTIASKKGELVFVKKYFDNLKDTNYLINNCFELNFMKKIPFCHNNDDLNNFQEYDGLISSNDQNFIDNSRQKKIFFITPWACSSFKMQNYNLKYLIYQHKKSFELVISPQLVSIFSFSAYLRTCTWLMQNMKLQDNLLKELNLEKSISLIPFDILLKKIDPLTAYLNYIVNIISDLDVENNLKISNEKIYNFLSISSEIPKLTSSSKFQKAKKCEIIRFAEFDISNKNSDKGKDSNSEIIADNTEKLLESSTETTYSTSIKSLIDFFNIRRLQPESLEIENEFLIESKKNFLLKYDNCLITSFWFTNLFEMPKLFQSIIEKNLNSSILKNLEIDKRKIDPTDSQMFVFFHNSSFQIYIDVSYNGCLLTHVDIELLEITLLNKKINKKNNTNNSESNNENFDFAVKHKITRTFMDSNTLNIPVNCYDLNFSVVNENFCHFYLLNMKFNYVTKNNKIALQLTKNEKITLCHTSGNTKLSQREWQALIFTI